MAASQPLGSPWKKRAFILFPQGKPCCPHGSAHPWLFGWWWFEQPRFGLPMPPPEIKSGGGNHHQVPPLHEMPHPSLCPGTPSALPWIPTMVARGNLTTHWRHIAVSWWLGAGSAAAWAVRAYRLHCMCLMALFWHQAQMVHLYCSRWNGRVQKVVFFSIPIEENMRITTICLKNVGPSYTRQKPKRFLWTL